MLFVAVSECMCMLNRPKNESSTACYRDDDDGGGGGGSRRIGMSISNQQIVTPEIYLKNFFFVQLCANTNK